MAEVAQHIRTTIRYDGPALAGHEMDVQDLAPALLALADIIQSANRRFNGDAASMRVLVNADVEQKCFQVDLSLVQSILDQARTLLGSPDVATAKEIAEWVGIIGGTGTGMFGLIKLFYGRKAEGATEFTVTQGASSTHVHINGNGNTVVVPREVYELTQDPGLVEKAKTVLKPLQREGYETLDFICGDRPAQHFTSEEAANIIAAAPISFQPAPTESISHITGTVRIKSPQYEGNAKWALMWNGRAIEAAMPIDWVAAFQSNQVQAPPNTHLSVKMREIVPLDEDGNAVGKPAYVVEEIVSVILPPQQASFLTSMPSGDRD